MSKKHKKQKKQKEHKKHKETFTESNKSPKSTNNTTTMNNDTEVAIGKRKRGRPKKVIVEANIDNNGGLDNLPILPKKRCRPKKIRVEEGSIREIPTKHGKFYGYCPECKLMLCSKDIFYKKFSCPGCGEEGKLEEMLEKREIERPRNKREYLQSVYSDWSLAKELRVKEEEKTIHPDVPAKAEEEHIIEEELPDEPEI